MSYLQTSKHRFRRASRQPIPGPSAVVEAPASAVSEAPSPAVVEPVSSPAVVEPVSSAASTSVAEPGGSGIVSGRFYTTAKKLPDGSYALPPSSSGSSYSASDSSS